MNPYYAITETYISLVVYLVMHQIFVIAGDFVEAFSIPAINIGIYVDKLSSVRALLMTIADVFEWAVTQEALEDPGNSKTIADLGPRRVLSVLSFLGMLVTRCYYLWVIYKSRNKAYVVFVTLSVEGFWFGLFQMGFFAIGPEYNAFTSFALHVSGNFVLFFQELIEYFSASHSDWNSLFRVRVHAWIAVVSSTLAWPLWIKFCQAYIQGAGEQSSFNKLVEKLKSEVISKLGSAGGTTATEIANKLKEALQAKQTEIKDLVKHDFGINEDVKVENTVEVKIGGKESPSGSATVNVKKKEGGSEPAATVTITVKGAKTESQARRIAWKLGSALSQESVNAEVKKKSHTVCQPTVDSVKWYHSMSALCMFPLGAFTEDFMYPGLLPYAFLDPQNANLINYTMPLFYMTGAVFVLLVNDVFHPTGFASGYGDSWFKDWSEGEDNGVWSYHYMWLLHVPILIVFVLCFMTIHGICPGLRVIVQSRWRVMLLTLTMLIPRSHLEVMGYVGVANYAIAASGTGDFTGFKILDQHHIPRYVINYQD